MGVFYMYKRIVKHKIINIFDALSRADYEPALKGMGSHFDHIFSGKHPLGGVRHSRKAMERWFKRLFSLSKNLNFTIKHIAVAGWPWDTTVVVEWHDSATLANGQPYDNDGVHVIRMRWGKVFSLHAYLDREIFVNACRVMREDGIAEADLKPIED